MFVSTHCLYVINRSTVFIDPGMQGVLIHTYIPGGLRYRFIRFSEKIGCPYQEFLKLAAEALVGYLRLELGEVGAGIRQPSVNCSADALLTFVLALGIDPTSLPDNWTCLCQQEG